MNVEPRKLIVVGQGYVGLPLAMRAVEVGYTVVGIDIDTGRIADLAEGLSHVDDVSTQQLRAALDSGRYLPTSDYLDAAGFDIAVISVPTPLREGLPDLSFIEQSSASLSLHLTKGAMVVLESTTYPGTTEGLMVPILVEGSGLLAGEDFFVGYSPERIDPGNAIWGFVETPKVISGINPASLAKVKSFYDDLVHTTVPVSSPKEAELTKLLENTFRHVNIALVNELAVFAHQLGVNVWESIEAASTKPFGFMKFTPGAGVGGHCLPVDPSYLSWQVKRKLGKNFRFIELANDVNDHMPNYVVERAIGLLNDKFLPMRGSNILILGLAYKKNTADNREAPALRVIELLQNYGATVSAVDSHVTPRRWPKNVSNVALTEEALRSSDLVILVTDHDDLDLDLVGTSQATVLDTKNLVTGANVHRL
jgi:UDP-N-acetyl-D-glucosamine dehydrogenase